jgi:hypothetical protein
MYVYIMLIQDILDNMYDNLKTPDELLAELDCAMDGLRRANDDMCYKEYVVTQVGKVLEVLNNDWSEAKRNRKDDILKKIGLIPN